METLIDWLAAASRFVGPLALLAAVVVYWLVTRTSGAAKYEYRTRRVEVPGLEGEVKVLTDKEERAASSRSVRMSRSSDVEAPGFYFRFEGDACSGWVLVRDRNVRLVFAQEMDPTRPPGIAFKGRKFLALFGKEARLAITISPGEGLETLGPEAVMARFKHGRLVEEVAFDLHVRKDCPDEVAVTAEFFLGGSRLYGLTFSKQVASEDVLLVSPPYLPPSEVDLDVVEAALKEQPPKDDGSGGELLLKLDLVGNGLLINVFHTTADTGMVAVGHALNTDLDKGSLQTLLAQLRAELGAAFYSSGVWERSTLPPLNVTDTEDLADCFERVASAGSILNLALRAKSSAVIRLFDYIEAQPPGTRLTIATSKVFLPFEILYARPFSRDLPPEERPDPPVSHGEFWGAKFALEVSYAAAGDYMALVQTHRRAPRGVSLNLNETISGTVAPTPMEIHGALESDLKARGVACASNSGCAEMKQILLGSKTDANLVYVYCHGSAADAAAGSLEELHLHDDDARCVVRPVGTYGYGYKNAPIVFLNACYSGATSPLFFTGFLESFRDRGALGLIATSFPVPVMFGARFGADVVTECVFGAGSLGERMRRLRLAHADHGNPVPLFYSVQCQLGR